MKNKPPKNGSKGGLSDEDAVLWEKAVSDVKGLKNKVKNTKTAPKNKPPSITPKPKQLPPKALPKSMDVPAGTGLDTRTDERLRRGQMRIEGRLDLHGMTQEQARTALRNFIVARQQRGNRCVLVITGKGSMKGGILKQKVPDWLWEPPLRDLVLRFYPARPQDGGDGALYVLLRRSRD